VAERVEIYLKGAGHPALFFKDSFAQVFVELDARPRMLLVAVHAPRDVPRSCSIAVEAGEAVFKVEGGRPERSSFRGRYLAEHPSPLRIPAGGVLRLWFVPATANRVKVRRASMLSIVLARLAAYLAGRLSAENRYGRGRINMVK